MEKCQRCLDLEVNPKGSHDVRGWMYPAPYSVQRYMMDAVEAVYACSFCDTRWIRTKTKSSGQIRWESK